MISAIEIINSVTNVLRTNFQVPVYSSNTKETFDKDCFFIEIAGDYSNIVASEYQSDTLTLRLTYFAITKQELKTLIKVREKLKSCFIHGVSGEDFHITLEDNLNFTITPDNNLEMLLPLHYVQYVPEDEGDVYIETLITNI